jgi:Acyl-CoA synthetases (AMP-forming)/AMP-acid ligases II
MRGDNMFKNFGSNVAVIDELYGSITYDELFKRADEIYSKIGKRCLVFSLCENTIESVAGYIAFLNNKIVPLLLSSKLDMELLKLLINTYNPDYMWMPTENVSDFEDMEVIFTQENYSLLKTGLSSGELFEELGLLLTTSGSTGSPKLVRQSYTNIKSNTESIIEYLKIDESERPITTLPMNYTYGLSIINTHLYAGATLLMTDKSLMQKDFWDFFVAQGATSFGGVPYNYEILNKLHFFRKDLPSLRYMTQAGGKLMPELHRKFAEYAEEQGKKFIVMYGQTEATARMAYLPAEKSLEKYGSMGIAIPGGRFELIDVDGNVITEPETVGELVYYGANVTLGYAEKKEDLALGDERQGCLVTGDMAKFDKDGYHYIVGRKKRFLKIFGNRVNLDETERLIKGRFEDVDVACAGVDDKMHVYITSEKFGDDIRAFLADKTHLNISAFEIRVIDEIPKNDSGKILYSDLK